MTHRLSVSLVCLACLWLWAGPAQGRAGSDLNADVRKVLSEKYLSGAQVGVAVARLGDSAEPHWLIRHSSTTPLIPASNLKLVTTAAALEQLGADFNFNTALLMKGNDVYLIGDGDPTLGDVEMLRKVGWGVDTVFKSWADELKKRGVTSIGNVFVDDSVFDEIFLHPNWPTDQAHKRYVAEVAGVNLNANCLDFYLRTLAYGQNVEYSTVPDTAYATIEDGCVFGNRNAVWLSRQLGGNDIILRGETNASNSEPISVTIHDPALFAATVLSETLSKNGVGVTGTVQRDRTARQAALRDRAGGGWRIVATLQTHLTSVISRANKDSMNLYAEAICKRLGFASTGGAESGSWANGTAAVASFLRQCGVPEAQFTLDDGCGLSKKNGISAEAIVRVLVHESAGANEAVFRDSLAVSGIDGTLDYRFRDSDLRGRVFGKSGYVNAVSALSGYLKARDGQWYAFSILMNDLPPGTNPRAKELQERIVEAIDDSVEPQVASGGQ